MKIFWLFAAAVALSGCAVTEATVPVLYTPSAATLDPRLAVVRVVVTASDVRTTNRGRIGTKINGYGMEMAAIRTSDDIAADVKSAIAAELKDRGYSAAAGGVVVDAQVTTFYAQFHNGILAGRADGQVDMTVKVASSGGAPLYSRDIHGTNQFSIQLASAGNAARAISSALSNATTILFDDPAFVSALAGKVAGAPPTPAT